MDPHLQVGSLAARQEAKLPAEPESRRARRDRTVPRRQLTEDGAAARFVGPEEVGTSRHWNGAPTVARPILIAR
jgi:hypothetical protein